jgi:drug/metabolite transporter (DMT)-like permease
LLLFAVVVFAWGTTWPVTKAIVASAPPLWACAIRSAIAGLALLALHLVRGDLALPPRGDMPVVMGIALLHMVAFAGLVAIGIQFIPAGRSVVLGYTTLLWVAPGARLFLGEPITAWRAAGLALGLGGLALMFNPLAFDWSDTGALFGNGLILLAALFWAVSILQVRAHKWLSTPFQLVFWEVLIATVALAVLAALVEGGAPHIVWSWQLVLLLLYAGVFGVVVAYWAMATVNRSLPALTTSLGILATPVVGTLCSAVALGEPLELPLLAAMALIIAGIAVGTVGGAPAARQA